MPVLNPLFVFHAQFLNQDMFPLLANRHNSISTELATLFIFLSTRGCLIVVIESTDKVVNYASNAAHQGA